MLRKIILVLLIAKAVTCYAQSPSSDIMRFGRTRVIHPSPAEFYVVPDSVTRRNYESTRTFILKPAELKGFRTYAITYFKKDNAPEIREVIPSYFICFAASSLCYEIGGGEQADEYFKLLLLYAEEHNTAGDYKKIIDRLNYLREQIKWNMSQQH